jgi:hypothetical protein
VVTRRIQIGRIHPVERARGRGIPTQFRFAEDRAQFVSRKHLQTADGFVSLAAVMGSGSNFVMLVVGVLRMLLVCSA